MAGRIMQARQNNRKGEVDFTCLPVKRRPCRKRGGPQVLGERWEQLGVKIIGRGPGSFIGLDVALAGFMTDAVMMLPQVSKKLSYMVDRSGSGLQVPQLLALLGMELERASASYTKLL
ncbi:hypothetical protein R1flu_017018 [Riccia fluitans]|uniref:Uncharacterized protein n=1 Tax=Riccia fluitans TaxID=41844 RepID=A0ABD1YSF5_9MARC